MLEEKDRRALAEIERHLSADDPAFARRMGRAGPFPTVSVLCLVTFLALPFVGLFLGPRAALIVINTAAATVLMVLACRRRRRH